MGEGVERGRGATREGQREIVSECVLECRPTRPQLFSFLFFFVCSSPLSHTRSPAPVAPPSLRAHHQKKNNAFPGPGLRPGAAHRPARGRARCWYGVEEEGGRDGARAGRAGGVKERGPGPAWPPIGFFSLARGVPRAERSHPGPDGAAVPAADRWSTLRSRFNTSKALACVGGRLCAFVEPPWPEKTASAFFSLARRQGGKKHARALLTTTTTLLSTQQTHPSSTAYQPSRKLLWGGWGW